jgi:hypothetical protein
MKETPTFVFFFYGTPAIEPSRKGKTIYLMATYDGIMIEVQRGHFVLQNLFGRWVGTLLP